MSMCAHQRKVSFAPGFTRVWFRIRGATLKFDLSVGPGLGVPSRGLLSNDGFKT